MSICYLQALLQNFAQLASLMITLVISFSLYQMIAKSNFKISENEWFYIPMCFIIPLILTPFPLLTQSYGDSKGWCWIQYNNVSDTIWMIVEFYGPLVLLLLVNIYFYIKIYKTIWGGQVLDLNIKLMKKMNNRLKMYPIVLVISFGPSLVHRIYYLTKGEDNQLLDISAACLNALYGFFNALVYGLNGRVKKLLKVWAHNLFSKTKRNFSTKLFDNN